MRILLVGHGRMGRLVESLAGEYGGEIVGIVDPASPAHSGPVDDDRWRGTDVAIDFTSPDAVMTNAPTLARRGINLVLGTTGWHHHEAELRGIVADAGVGVVAAPNFSAGVVLFGAVVSYAAKLFSSRDDFGAFLHETHHAMKKDAPSGTALLLKAAMEQSGYTRRIDVSSTRAGQNPGEHVVGFDGPSESITLSHVARDRGAFARGALMAARWVQGKRGWYSMRDVLEL
jgi:4-hydroxy-tetrahydrodipicolinate reductase